MAVIVAMVVVAVVSLSYQDENGPAPRKSGLPHLAAPCRCRREISRVVGFNFFHDWKQALQNQACMDGLGMDVHFVS